MMHIKLLHLITTLDTGGAEMMLYKLISRMDREAFQAKVVSLTDIGPVGKKIQALGVTVRHLGMRRGVPNPVGLIRLIKWFRQDLPHVIQTWMYHANLIGALAARSAGSMPVTWGIHHSNLDPRGNKGSTIWTAKACATLSHWLPAKIVCCSEASRRVHSKLDYMAEKIMVISNGFDLDLFKPDPTVRLSVHKELNIPEEAPLIGLVGRFDPQKDHRNFVQAAALLNASRPDVHFLLCGDGVTWKNQQLAGWIQAAGIYTRCHLLGRREDMPRLNAALDIVSSSSAYGEGFPNVLGEAMACEVPCVVTDVGDSARIVGETGRVVPPKAPEALAMAWKELIDLGEEGRRKLGEAARKRVKDHFELSTIVKQYEALYTSLVMRGADDQE